MILRPGLSLRSATSTAEFVVIRCGSDDVDLRCAGAVLLSLEEAVAAPGGAAGSADQLQVGKRYSDEEGLLELLCTKPGPGPLTLNGAPLDVRAAKSLPSSD